MNILTLTNDEREIIERALREWEPKRQLYRTDSSGSKAYNNDIALARDLANKVRVL